MSRANLRRKVTGMCRWRTLSNRRRVWNNAEAKLRRLVRHHVNGSIEQEYGADWSEASSWSIDEAKEFKGGDKLFPGGFDQITSYLAKGLDVRLGQSVQKLAPTKSGVSITLSDGSTLEADHAVVTVPTWRFASGQD